MAEVLEQVKQVLIDHETSYKSPSKGTEHPTQWRWSCSCGEEKLLETRELCAQQTREHWAGLIDKAVRESPAPDTLKDGESLYEEKDIIERSPLDYMSFLIHQVDLQTFTMPQARKKLGEWYTALPDKSLAREEGRVRMRRLKQITDGLFEEFGALMGSQGA